MENNSIPIDQPDAQPIDRPKHFIELEKFDVNRLQIGMGNRYGPNNCVRSCFINYLYDNGMYSRLNIFINKHQIRKRNINKLYGIIVHDDGENQMLFKVLNSIRDKYMEFLINNIPNANRENLNRNPNTHRVRLFDKVMKIVLLGHKKHGFENKNADSLHQISERIGRDNSDVFFYEMSGFLEIKLGVYLQSDRRNRESETAFFRPVITYAEIGLNKARNNSTIKTIDNIVATDYSLEI